MGFATVSHDTNHALFTETVRTGSVEATDLGSIKGELTLAAVLNLETTNAQSIGIGNFSLPNGYFPAPGIEASRRETPSSTSVLKDISTNLLEIFTGLEACHESSHDEPTFQ